MRKKIVIFCDSPGFGGSEVRLLTILNKFKLKYEFICVVQPKCSEEIIIFLKENQITYFVSCVGNGLLESPFALLISLRIILRTPANLYIFWCHHLNSNRWAQVAAALLRKTYVVCEQSLPEIRLSWHIMLTKVFVNCFAQKVVLCGFSHVEVYRRKYISRNVIAIPNSRNVLKISKEVQRWSRENASEKFTIITASRLSEEKDLFTLINAFSNLKSSLSAELLILGDGPLRNKLEEFVISKDIQNISFLGQVNNLNYFLSFSNLFVLTSLYEGLPGALIEAMAAKVPCIASDVPGNNELIANNITGLLFPVGNHSILASQIEYMISNSNFRKVVVNNAFKLVLSKYDYQLEMDNWESVFDDII